MSNTTSNTAKNSYGRKRRKRRNYSKLDRKIANVANQVILQREKKVQEMKTFDHPEVVGTNCTNAGLVYELSELITQGDAYNQREGDEIMLKGLQMRLQVEAASNATFNSVRLVIFRWNTFGAITPASLLDQTTSTLIRHLSPLSQDNKKFIQVLYDNIYQVSAGTNSDFSSVVVDKLYIKLAGKSLWNSVGNNKSGQIFMIAISDSALADAPTISFISRLKFTDP